jgi:hypothetical protein
VVVGSGGGTAEGWDGVTLRTLRGGAVAQIVEGGLGRSSEVFRIEERQGQRPSR